MNSKKFQELLDIELTQEQKEYYIGGLIGRVEKRNKKFKDNYDEFKWTKLNDDFEYNT